MVSYKVTRYLLIHFYNINENVLIHCAIVSCYFTLYCMTLNVFFTILYHFLHSCLDCCFPFLQWHFWPIRIYFLWSMSSFRSPHFHVFVNFDKLQSQICSWALRVTVRWMAVFKEAADPPNMHKHTDTCAFLFPFPQLLSDEAGRGSRWCETSISSLAALRVSAGISHDPPGPDKQLLDADLPPRSELLVQENQIISAQTNTIKAWNNRTFAKEIWGWPGQPLVWNCEHKQDVGENDRSLSK